MQESSDPQPYGAAPGGPGLPPRWTTGAKDAVGTAYSASSRLWFTLAEGIVTEVYFPTLDRPQLRDVQLLFTDGETFFHDERRDFIAEVEPLSPHALGFRVTSRARSGRYRIVKEIIADPHQAALLMQVRLEVEEDLRRALRVFVLVAPRANGKGWGNTAEVREVSGRQLLMAHNEGMYAAAGASVPLRRASSGYVGVNDGWTDLAEHRRMDWTFAVAENGHVALTGELDVRETTEFTLAVALSDCPHGAITTLFQSLGVRFEVQRKRFVDQWERGCRNDPRMARLAGDGGRLYHMSQSLLLAHEDKTYPGAMIASLSIPWGEARGDDDLGGYHLVWTRDLVKSATGLLAAGNTITPLRALIYLAASQQPDGGFAQNSFVSGEPYWCGVQLDEVALPILLARRLHTLGTLETFDPYEMVRRAASFLVRHGPATAQERWEEASGYSPSTLAAVIAALICAAAFANERDEQQTAEYLEQYADFLEAHVEAWTVTTDGALLPDIPRHYIRIHPVRMDDPTASEDPNAGMLRIANRRPGDRAEYPAKDVVDAGFLDLVRYGIRPGGDPLIEDSLRVVDAVLRVETPFGPAWRRYNHDGYGQRDDGGPFEGWGRGRAWPLLAGERGHYELAAGRDVGPYLRALESFASRSGLLTEQVWDAAPLPEHSLNLGRPTGAAMPLLWPHAEYLTLLRSVADGAIFDEVPEVAERYRVRRTRRQWPAAPALEVWKPNRQVTCVSPGVTLRVQRPEGFTLRWTGDEWEHSEEMQSIATALGIEFVDIRVSHDQRAPIRFVFFVPSEHRTEQQAYVVRVQMPVAAGHG